MPGDDIDRHIGMRLRHGRERRRMGLQSLAGDLGVTYQQVVKYEKGINRVSAAMLFRMARILDVDVLFFFEGLDLCGPTTMPCAPTGDEGLDLSGAVARVHDPSVRQKLRDLIDAIEQAKVQP